MVLQPLFNEGPHAMVEILASRMHVLRNIFCVFFLDLPTNISLHTHT